jgi:tRNA pseudouridine55 synthase
MAAGFILIDKESGWTSHDVVAKVRHHVGGKVGHAGTLDPMATGLLVLAVGGATRLLRFVQASRKEYLATAMFGVATDSLDADGAVISRDPMSVSREDVEGVLDRFRGEIVQVPPMVSARKVEGKRLYELAREGKVVEREARPVTIGEISIVDFAPSDYPEVDLKIVCSTGTYIRTLGDDIARSLGGRAHLTSLRRTRNGSLDVADAVPVASVVDAFDAGTLDDLIIGAAEALDGFDAVVVDKPMAFRVRNGRPMACEPSSGIEDDAFVRVVDDDGSLIAVYRRADEQLLPEVVLA